MGLLLNDSAEVAALTLEVVHKSYFHITDFKHVLCKNEFRTKGGASKPCVIQAKLTRAAVA